MIFSPNLIPYSSQLAMSKREAENKSRGYAMVGSETLGSYLQIQTCSENVPQLPSCSIQWFRVSPDGSWNEAISGIHTTNVSNLSPES